MKILHISRFYNDGYGYQENILPYYQKLLGHEVVHITSDRMSAFVPPEKRIVGVKEYYENGVKIIRLPVKGKFKKRYVFLHGLYKTIEKEKPDYIFHHGLTSLSIFTVVKYKKAHPGVFLAVDNHADINISHGSVTWKLLLFWKILLKKCYKHIDLIFGVTPLRCLFPIKYLSAPIDKIRFLPIGADTKNVPKENMFELRKKYGFDKNDLIIVTGGKITKRKRMDKILDAFKIIEGENVKLIIFGKIFDKDFEKKMVKTKNVKYLGWLDRKKTLEVLKLADIAIWNTQHTTLIEDAIATETPLILRYYGTTAHFIDGNGLYLYSNSVKEIYEKIKLLIENKEFLNKMKKASMKMSKLLSYENVAKESIEYYYDSSPKFIHKYFMNDKFIDENYEHFEKISY
ncbi:glycosyltransferase [Thermosipho ferrireducens]|uniref:Glycosyltransferase n=1 Tax=Thermosipho ferrireducens TaxID=2571116 RepID=A0ABX7S947_9BACT|nr:glycosyltransferase [Thermosipho ferrireducens]QTA38483.1 glycosyltransferase [Thermosipho ferrireducens]